MKKMCLLIALFLGAGLLMQAQSQPKTFSYNASSGTISVGCSTSTGTNNVAYHDDVNVTWNVNIGQSKCVKIVYGCNIEAGYDVVELYNVDANGNSSPYAMLTLTGTMSGTAYSDLPTGKIKVVFKTDNSVCCYDLNYSGFFVSFAPDDRTSIGPGPTLFQGTISGNLPRQAIRIQTTSGNLDLGPQDDAYANLSTDRPGFFFNKTVYLQNGILGTHHTTTADLKFLTYGTTRMTILNSNGNVGIGTTSPSTKLHVAGSVYLPSNNSYWIGSYSDSGNRLKLNHNGTNAYIDYAPNLYLRAGTNPVVTFLQNGRVGIGTTNPDSEYLLDVKGAFRATKIVAEDVSHFADFVFDKGYRLPTLSEVDQFIRENGRLPDIPSEAEVKTKGLDLVEMQVKLLQKIEELTLYAIQQQEMIDKLNAKIEKMENGK